MRVEQSLSRVKINPVLRPNPLSRQTACRKQYSMYVMANENVLEAGVSLSQQPALSRLMDIGENTCHHSAVLNCVEVCVCVCVCLRLRGSCLIRTKKWQNKPLFNALTSVRQLPYIVVMIPDVILIEIRSDCVFRSGWWQSYSLVFGHWLQSNDHPCCLFTPAQLKSLLQSSSEQLTPGKS